MSENKKQCFVVMPFSDTINHDEQYWTDHFEKFLKPLLEQTGFEPSRSEPLRGDILKTIISNIIRAQVVVTDITDSNPNVFWELGVRQSFKNGTITIAEIGTEVPFDLSIKGILWYYPKDHIKNAEFVKKFHRAIKDCTTNPNSPDSQVLDTISGRGTFFEIIQKDETLRRVEALIEETIYNKAMSRVIKLQLESNNGVCNAQFGICSLELLLTHRYLDQSATFYQTIRGNYVQLVYYNTTFQTIGANHEQIKTHFALADGTTWQKEFDCKTIESFDSLIKELKDIHKKIKDSY